LARFGGAVSVAGATHPLPAWRALAAGAASAGSWAALAYAAAGQAVLGALGLAEPRALAAARESRVALGAAFLALSLLAGKLGATGAYEVALDGAPVWSKLARGAPPPVEAIVAAVEAALAAA